MKSFAMITGSGILGLVVLKLMATFLLPLLMMAFGFLALLFKVALIAGLGYVVYTLFRRSCRPAAEA